jgi:hypothetical protein
MTWDRRPKNSLATGEDRCGTMAEPVPPAPPAPVRASGIEKPALPKPTRFVNGKKNKGVSGENLVIETLRSGSADLSELKRVFTHRGFAPTSASPTLSRMMRDGEVERGPHGRFKLTSNGACQ